MTGETFETEPCRSCGAPVIWAHHHVTGKAAPIDALSVPGARCNVYREESEEWGTRVVYAIGSALGGGMRHPHFATCPQAARWRAK